MNFAKKITAWISLFAVAFFIFAGGAVSAASNPLSTDISISQYSGFPSGINGSSSAKFAGGVYDGNGNIWLVPVNAAQVVKLDTQTGEMTGFDGWPSGISGSDTYKFRSGVYDGNGGVWLIPFHAGIIIKIDTTTGEMTGYDSWPSGFGSGATSKFIGGCFYDGYIWMVPRSADRVIRLDTSTGAMTGFSGWPAGFDGTDFKFYGGVSDENGSLFMVPSGANMVVKVDLTNGQMTGYGDFPSGVSGSESDKFAGGVCDGAGNIWLVPSSAKMVVKVSAATGAMTGYNGFPSGISPSDTNKFVGAAFDGASIWLSPSNAAQAVKLNPVTGQMSVVGGFSSGSTSKFFGAVFDGSSVWLIPSNYGSIIKLSSSLIIPSPPAGGDNQGGVEPSPNPDLPQSPDIPVSTPEDENTGMPGGADSTDEKTTAPLPDEAVEANESTVTYVLSNIGNNSGSTGCRFMIIDYPSENFKLLSGKIPAFSKGEGLSYRLLYKSGATYTVLSENIPANAPYTFEMPESIDGHISEIVILLDEVPPGFAVGNTVEYTFETLDKEHSNSYSVFWESDEIAGTSVSLSGMIDNTLDNYADADVYSKESWDNLQSAVQSAQLAINDPHSTAAQIMTAQQELKAAINTLEAPDTGTPFPSMKAVMLFISLAALIAAGSTLILRRNRAKKYSNDSAT